LHSYEQKDYQPVSSCSIGQLGILFLFFYGVSPRLALWFHCCHGNATLQVGLRYFDDQLQKNKNACPREPLHYLAK